MTDPCRRTLDIINEKGLHARASARLVEVVEDHDADAVVDHAHGQRLRVAAQLDGAAESEPFELCSQRGH